MQFGKRLSADLLKKIEIFFLTLHVALLYSICPFVMWVSVGCTAT